MVLAADPDDLIVRLAADLIFDAVADLRCECPVRFVLERASRFDPFLEPRPWKSLMLAADFLARRSACSGSGTPS